MKRLFHNKNFTIGFIIISILLLICFIGIFYTPYSPNEMYTNLKFTSPGKIFALGSDNYGRDILSRIIKGIQIGFVTGSAGVLTGVLFGLPLGAYSGYYGGIADGVISRVIDVLMAFPTVLLALMLAAVFNGGLKSTLLVIGIMNVPRFARISRGSFIQARQYEYVLSARLKGASDFRIIFYHILPNVKSALIVNGAFSFSLSVLSEAGLSYLGLGIMPPDPSLGRMLRESQPYLAKAPWYTVFTGLAIVLMVLGFNLIGDGFNEVSNDKGK